MTREGEYRNGRFILPCGCWSGKAESGECAEHRRQSAAEYFARYLAAARKAVEPHDHDAHEDEE